MVEGNIEYQKQLYKYTTMEIGGEALMWIEPRDEKDLVNILEYVNGTGDEIFVIGRGSNLIIHSDKLDYLFIKLSHSNFKNIGFDGNKVRLGAGIEMERPIYYSYKKNLSGLEYFTLVPSTIGGAVMSDLSTKIDSKKYKFVDLINKMKLLDKESLEVEEIRGTENAQFLKNKIILEVELELKKDDLKNILHRKEKIMEYRKETQEYNYPSCGCIFKNPSNICAGKLIERIGLKGKKIGGAKVSHKHANFIINYDNATSNDVISLIELVQEKIFRNTGVWLEPEVEILQ